MKSALVTAAWQAGRLDDAIRYMVPEMGPNFTSAEAVDALARRLSLPSPETRAFEVVNCLRIAAAYCDTDRSQSLDLALRNSLELVAKRVGTDHPYEQWLKWLGVIHLQCEEFTEAENCFAAAKEICTNHQFTMRTIGASIELLRVLTKRIKRPGKAIPTTETLFYQELEKLREESISFDAYVSTSKVLETLESQQLNMREENRTLWDLYTFLPFSYS